MVINESLLAAKSFGEIVRYLRKRSGYSQKELAEIADVSPSTISNYENNRSYPDVMTLCALACALNVSMNLLLRAYDPKDWSKPLF